MADELDDLILERRIAARRRPAPELRPYNGDFFDTAALQEPVTGSTAEQDTSPPVSDQARVFARSASRASLQAASEIERAPANAAGFIRRIFTGETQEEAVRKIRQASVGVFGAEQILNSDEFAKAARRQEYGLSLENPDARGGWAERAGNVLGPLPQIIVQGVMAPETLPGTFAVQGASGGLEQAGNAPPGEALNFAAARALTGYGAAQAPVGALSGTQPALGSAAAMTLYTYMQSAADTLAAKATYDPQAKLDLEELNKQAVLMFGVGLGMGALAPKHEPATPQKVEVDAAGYREAVRKAAEESGVPIPKVEAADTGTVKPLEEMTAEELYVDTKRALGEEPKPGMASEPLKQEPLAAQEVTPEGGAEANKAEPEPIAPVTEPEGFQTSTKNAVTEAERTIRGAAPIEAEAARDFGTLWEEAKAASPEEARALVDQLAEKHRTVSDRENALILRRKIEVRNAFEDNAKAMEAARESGDTESLQRTKQQNAILLDELDKIDIVNKNIGREGGRGLNARKMEARNDMTLAAVMTRMRAENGYEPLSPDVQARITKLVTEREAAYKELDKLRGEMEARLSNVEDAVASIESAPPKPGKILDFFDKRGNEAMARLKKRMASPSANIFLDPEVISDLTLVAAKYIAHGVDATAQLVKDFGEEIKPHIDDIVSRARALHDEQLRKATPMERREKAAERAIGRRQEMLKTGDVMPKKRVVEPPSRRLLELQAEAARYDKLIEHERNKIRKANMGRFEKGSEILTRWNRAWILSSPAVFGKLAAASAWRLGFMPIREGLGAAIGKAIPKISEKANVEGGSSVRALARGYSQAFSRSIDDAWRTLKHGGTEMDQAFGKKHIVPTEGVEFIGAMHGAMKAPLKRASFEYALQKGYEGAIREGLDVNDPLVQMRVGMDAYKFAERQLFLQDNVAVKALKVFNATLRRSDSHAAKSTATAIDLMTPVVKIPTNIIAEAFEHVFGSVTGSVQAAKAYRNGIEKLSRQDAEAIMRQLKNGTLGFAAMTLGWALYENLGGQYDRSDKKMKPGTAKVFGVTIPASALHLPFHEVMMAAATAHKYADKKNKDIDDGLLKAMLGLVEDIPLARETVEVGRIVSGEKDPRDILGQRLVPQGVKDIAKWTDSSEDRKAKGFFENLKKGIPGARETLPVKR